MTVRLDSIVVRDSEPIATTIDDEVVMLSPRAQAYFGLGTVGSEIWNAIEQPTRVGELCAALTRDFDVDPQTCQTEVLAFLDDLVGRGLARIASEEEES